MSSKFSDADVKGPVRIFFSSQGLAPFDESMLSQLLELHPSATQEASHLPALQENDARFHTTETEESVKRTIMGFCFSSSAGPDGLRPGG